MSSESSHGPDESRKSPPMILFLSADDDTFWISFQENLLASALPIASSLYSSSSCCLYHGFETSEREGIVS